MNGVMVIEVRGELLLVADGKAIATVTDPRGCRKLVNRLARAEGREEEVDAPLAVTEPTTAGCEVCADPELYDIQHTHDGPRGPVEVRRR